MERACQNCNNTNITHKNSTNPHPKESYNSGLEYNEGSPVFSTDLNWMIWQLNHGLTIE